MSQISETYNIDCLEYMKSIPDNFFDLAVVDPPYGIDIANMNMGAGKGKKRSKLKNRKWSPKGWDTKPPEEIFFIELKRVSKNQIIWGGNYFNLGPCLHYIVWDKQIFSGLSFADCEMAWTSFKVAPAIFRRSVFLDKKSRFHPTQKPLELYKWILQNYAKPGQKIFDSHLGSQSSRIAAWDMGFDFWGCELDEDYFKQGNERFEDHKAKHQTLFDKKEMFFPEQLTLL